MRLTIILLFLCVITVPGRSQRASSTFSRAEGSEYGEHDSPIAFSEGPNTYTITPRGKGTVKLRDGTLRAFDLRLARGDFLQDYLYHAEYNGDLLLIYQAGDVEYGAGFMARLDLKSLRLIWKASIGGFNVGNGLFDDGYVYVTSLGFIGKINVETGTFAWRHRNLYRYRSGTDAFGSFEIPELSGNTVDFKDPNIYQREKTPHIVVHRVTGRILNVVR